MNMVLVPCHTKYCPKMTSYKRQLNIASGSEQQADFWRKLLATLAQ